MKVEITARDASNTRLRSKQACFPTLKTIEGFDLAASSIAAPTWAYLTSLEWISARENLTLIGPAGTGKSHVPIALWHQPSIPACGSGTSSPPSSSRTSTAAWRTTASGSHRDPAPTRPDHLRRGRLRTAGQHRQPVAVAAAYERRSLAIASHWPFEEWGRFLPDHSTAISLLDRLLHHNNIVATDGESYRMREARSQSGGRPTKR